MTRRTNARVAGYAFLLYIALGIASLVLFGSASKGEGIGEQLAAIARNDSQIRLTAVLNLLCGFAALTLAVTLHAITRDQDRELAMLGLVCRVGEGVFGAIATQAALGLLWLGSNVGTSAIDRQGALAIGAFYLGQRSSPLIAGTLFAVGSTCFAWLMLRGRMIPIVLAWLGVSASVLLVVALPLQLAGVIRGPFGQFVWLPMAVFEVWLAAWFIVKGVAAPEGDRSRISGEGYAPGPGGHARPRRLPPDTRLVVPPRVGDGASTE